MYWIGKSTFFQKSPTIFHIFLPLEGHGRLVKTTIGKFLVFMVDGRSDGSCPTKSTMGIPKKTT